MSIAGAIEREKHSSKPPEIMRKGEVAKYLKKSSATINRWMRYNGLLIMARRRTYIQPFSQEMHGYQICNYVSLQAIQLSRHLKRGPAIATFLSS